MNEKEFNEQLQAISDRVLSKALSQNEETNYTESLFESIRHINEYGQDFWYARELQVALEYTEWRNFCKVIDKAKEACKGSDIAVSDHFVEVNKIVSKIKTAPGCNQERNSEPYRRKTYENKCKWN